MAGYQPDLSLLNPTGHIAPSPDGMPPPMDQATPRDPMITSMLQGIQGDLAGGGAPQGGNDLYKYAMLSAMLGSAGAGLGMAFRPWVKPPQALPSPQAPQMPITAPASLSALAQTRSGRKGF